LFFFVWELEANTSILKINGEFAQAIPDWSVPENWTSDLRKHCGHPAFDKHGEYADFTYRDNGGYMSRLLSQWANGARHIPQDAGAGVRYHIELKTTTEGLVSPFHLSGSQAKMAKRLVLHNQGNPSKDVYVLLRLYNFVGSTKGKAKGEVKVCIDPWNNDEVEIWFPDLEGRVHDKSSAAW
jgi:hypothetical protein